MKRLTFLFLASTQFLMAQTTKSVGDFTKVTGFDQISIVLIPAGENKVELSGTNSEQVEFVNNNGELKIRMPLQKLLKGEDVLAKVYFKKIEAAEANEGSHIKSEATIKSINFDIIAKEGATVQLNLEASRVAARSSGGSEIKLQGTTQNFEAIANSGAKVYAKDFVASQATATVNAGGEIEINASDFIDAKSRAGGSIIIYGDPKQVNQKTILGGNIIVKSNKKYHTN